MTKALFRVLAVAALLLQGCYPMARLQPYDRSIHKNYLVTHKGGIEEFTQVSCFRIAEATDSSRAFNIEPHLRRLIQQQIPLLHECGQRPEVALEIRYYAGPGVCIDCDTGPRDPQSGYAFITAVSTDGNAIAEAEWQYWRGGTAQFMAQQFLFDLVNLIIHGISKPVS